MAITAWVVKIADDIPVKNKYWIENWGFEIIRREIFTFSLILFIDEVVNIIIPRNYKIFWIYFQKCRGSGGFKCLNDVKSMLVILVCFSHRKHCIISRLKLRTFPAEWLIKSLENTSNSKIRLNFFFNSRALRIFNIRPKIHKNTYPITISGPCQCQIRRKFKFFIGLKQCSESGYYLSVNFLVVAP